MLLKRYETALKPRGRAIAIAVALISIAVLAGWIWQIVYSAGVPWLHTSGGAIYDEDNHRVFLFGANYFYLNGQTVALSDIEALKPLGFNVFRIFVPWSLLQPYNETLNGIDESYLITGVSTPDPQGHPPNPPLDTLVRYAVRANMYIIICLDAWRGSYPPPAWAFPWATHTGLDAAWASQEPERALSEEAYAALINGTAVKERIGITNAWRFLASRYRGVPNVIFELLNEPYVSFNNVKLGGDAYTEFNEQIISSIESAETHPHLKLIEFLRDHWDHEIAMTAVDVSRPNCVWAIHENRMPWDPSGEYSIEEPFVWHGRSFKAGYVNGTVFLASWIVGVAGRINGWNKPWISSEFSAWVNDTHWRDWLRESLDLMSEYHSSGAVWWCYSDENPEWSLSNQNTRQQVMSVLGPYMKSLDPSDDTKSTMLGIQVRSSLLDFGERLVH